ncbi:MAG: hypothetical protein R2701_01235 [Acidimicrobiales bacterium]|nr:hypothetical protein [Acidimicrobiales bacterium]
MSIRVDLQDLPSVVAERGLAAYLVTVRDDRPHVVMVQVGSREGLLVVAPGRRTSANIADRPEVTLLWPVSVTHPNHSLLVDGRAAMSVDGEWLEIEPTSAVLHRVGGRRRQP